MNVDQTHSDVSRDVSFDVIVIGGGAAGLAATLVLARSRRRVLLVDAGEPRNAPADQVHNYVGREGTPPLELTAIGREEVEQYGAEVVSAAVTAARSTGDLEPAFELDVSDGRTLLTRRIILATGVRDALPEVTGLAERWGRDVLHCPYCHGWEVRDQRIGILATGPAALHQAGLFRQLSDQVTVLVNGSDLSHRDRVRHVARGVDFVEGDVVEVLTTDDRLSGVRLADGSIVELDALVVASFPDASCDLAEQLGVPTREVAMGEHVMARSLAAAPMTGATDVPGVVVAGNAAFPMGTTIGAAADGTQVGAALNADLVEADGVAALEEYRAAQNEPDPWDERYSAAEHVWSGNVNPRLPDLTGDLPRGRALDVGSGEGGDVLWLAEQGWDVTGLDFSAAGLARAAEHAEARGLTDRTQWRREDARTWEPDEQWDLVTSHYLHLAGDQMPEAVGRIARAVAPGGTLLVVLHHPEDVGARHDPSGDAAQELARGLDRQEWDVRTDVVERTHTGHGPDVVVRDVVLFATRR